MKRAILLIFAAIVFVCIAYADDVWKAKPYQQWDAKDIQKILNESPWARVVHIEATWRKPGDTTLPVDQGGTSAGNYGAYGGGGPTNANSGSLTQNQSILNSAKTPQATFVVRWFSARTVRQALARAQVLAGAMTQADADKALTDESAEFTLVVVGQDMSPFVKVEERDLTAKSFIQPKGGDKTAPSHVIIQRAPGSKPEDPRSISAVVFYFPKKTVGGEPLFATNAKSAEFACQTAGATIKTSFDLPKMTDKSGADW